MAYKTIPRAEVEATLRERARRDRAFRTELRANPRAVIERELGGTLAEDVDVQVIEETATIRYLVLPPELPGT